MQKSQILGVGSYLPEDVIKSIDLFEEIKSESQYGVEKDWMINRMGIQERRYSKLDEKPSDLAIPAAEKAIQDSGIDRSEIDLIIFCGMERDQPEPATAHTIARSIGVNASNCFDVGNACYGFVQGIKIANSFIESGMASNALIVTSEICSHVVRKVVNRLKKGVPESQFKNYVGFLSAGDAGGAVLIGKSRDGVSGFNLYNSFTRSDKVEKCYYNFDAEGRLSANMDMGTLAAILINGHSKIMNDTLDSLGWDNFDYLLSHQIGSVPFERISKMTGFEKQEKVNTVDQKLGKHIKTYDFLGNIATATFPLSFEKLLKRDNLKTGDRIGGFFAGSGITIGQFGYTI
jgi:3-oxoacyl-[acyl-carrier-protein] synthase-3